MTPFPPEASGSPQSPDSFQCSLPCFSSLIFATSNPSAAPDFPFSPSPAAPPELTLGGLSQPQALHAVPLGGSLLCTCGPAPLSRVLKAHLLGKRLWVTNGWPEQGPDAERCPCCPRHLGKWQLPLCKARRPHEVALWPSSWTALSLHCLPSQPTTVLTA